jgi:glutamate-1-semialdehyde 2,1-aminomutase
MVNGIVAAAKEAGIAMTSNQAGAMFGLFFSDEDEISNFAQVTACNLERFQHFFHGMLEEGVYLAPSAYEAGFVSSAHSQEDLEHTIEAARKVFSRL